LLLNSLKLNFTAFVVFRAPVGGAGDIFVALLILAVINIAPIIFYRLLRKHHADLTDDEHKKVFGTLYQGKNIDKD